MDNTHRNRACPITLLRLLVNEATAQVKAY